MSKQRRTFLKSVGSVGLAGVLAGCGQPDDPEGEGMPMTEQEDTPEETEADTPEETETETDTPEEDTPEPESASLRVAHLSPDAPDVDVYLDGDAVLEGVPFGTFSDYLDVAGGEHEVRITAAGDTDTVVFDDSVELSGDTTAAAIGELADENQPFSVELLEDDRSDPGENARVRLLHASPDAPNVDSTLVESGDVLFEDVPFGAAGTVEVPEGAYTLEVRPATENNDGDVVATFDVEVAAGTVYTAAAVGYLMPEEAPADEPFDLLVAVDREPN